MLAADGDVNILQPDHLVQLALPLVDAAVAGEHHTDFVIEMFDGLRKGAGDIREPARFGKWLHFAGNEQNV